MLRFLALSVLVTLGLSGTNAGASVEWKDQLYQQANGRVVQSRKTEKGKWVERVSLPDEGEDSFYELWCRKTEGYCPRGVAERIVEAEALYRSYEDLALSAKTELARKRARREAQAVQEVLSKHQADREFLSEMVDDYLKTPSPYHFEEEKDQAYLDVVKVWSRLFEDALAKKARVERLQKLNFDFTCKSSCNGEHSAAKHVFKFDQEQECRASVKSKGECKGRYSFLFAPYLSPDRIRRESSEYKKNREYWRDSEIASKKAEESDRFSRMARYGPVSSLVDKFNFEEFSNKAAEALCLKLDWNDERFIYYRTSDQAMSVASYLYEDDSPGLIGARCKEVFTQSESSQIRPANTELDYRNYTLTQEDTSRYQLFK